MSRSALMKTRPSSVSSASQFGPQAWLIHFAALPPSLPSMTCLSSMWKKNVWFGSSGLCGGSFCACFQVMTLPVYSMIDSPSAVGHLLEIKAPEEYDVKRGKWSFAHLPVIPPHFDLAPLDKTKTRLNAIVRLVKRKDVGELINACDAGREGELIFRLIQQHAK